MSIQTLKKYVNDPQFWLNFLELLDEEIEAQHKKLEQADTLVSLHRAQGEVAALRRLKLLRDRLNNG